MSAPAIADGFAVGAALLALWLDVRLPVLGARTFPRALALTVCANVLLFFIGVATAVLAAFVYTVARFAPRRERYHGVCATGISPVGALDHVEAAVRTLDGYTTVRADDRVTITRHPPIATELEDRLEVKATRADVGTIVEIDGYAEPKVIAAARDAIARTPPWTSSP